MTTPGVLLMLALFAGQLGFTPLGAASFSNATFGQGSGPILLDEVRCVGTESRLADCPADPIGVHKCEQSASAGVRCIAGMVLYRLYSGDVSKVAVYQHKR